MPRRPASRAINEAARLPAGDGVPRCNPPGVARAEARHGLSTFGDLKYPAGFSHFDYVNPDAPKGGRIVTIGTSGLTTFDSFNGYILKGDPVQLIELLFDTLMVRAFDEPDAVYGLVAEGADIGERPHERHVCPAARGAVFRWQPAFSGRRGGELPLLKTHGHEQYRILIRDVVAAEAVDPRTVRYSFTGDNVRDLPGIIASLPIFSRA